jgi:hypothetical protein
MTDNHPCDNCNECFDQSSMSPCHGLCDKHLCETCKDETEGGWRMLTVEAYHRILKRRKDKRAHAKAVLRAELQGTDCPVREDEDEDKEGEEDDIEEEEVICCKECADTEPRLSERELLDYFLEQAKLTEEEATHAAYRARLLDEIRREDSKKKRKSEADKHEDQAKKAKTSISPPKES